jgi:hypothetical protein
MHSQPGFAGAVSVVDSLAALLHCVSTPPGKRNWELTPNLCNKCSCSCMSKSAANAQHATIAIEHACEWFTRDIDFLRFVPHGLNLPLLEP